MVILVLQFGSEVSDGGRGTFAANLLVTIIDSWPRVCFLVEAILSLVHGSSAALKKQLITCVFFVSLEIGTETSTVHSQLNTVAKGLFQIPKTATELPVCQSNQNSLNLSTAVRLLPSIELPVQINRR